MKDPSKTNFVALNLMCTDPGLSATVSTIGL